MAITIMSMLFAYSQKIRAKHTEMMAIKQTEIAMSMKEQLEQQRLIAQQEAIRAGIAEDSAIVAMDRAEILRQMAELQSARAKAAERKAAECCK